MYGSAPSVAAASHVERDDEEPFRIPSRWSPRVARMTATGDAAGERAGGEERPHRFAVADRHAGRNEDGEAEVGEQRPDDVQGTDDVDREERHAARGANPLGLAHSAFSTSGTRRDSVKMIARSPARRTSSPRGKTAVPSRTIARSEHRGSACP